MQNKVSEKVQERVFAQIFKRPENSECADCSAKGPRWVSLDYGIFICMNCAGAHRTLGPSVTRVRSTKLDGWIQEHIDIMEGIGNGVANSYYENQLTKSYTKPSMSASLETLIKFVNEKYVKKLFIPQNGVQDPKTAFQSQKISLKPYYFDDQHNTSDTLQSQEAKVQTGALLGDLLNMDDQDEFQEYQSPGVELLDQAGNQTNISNLTQHGSTPNIMSFKSLSPRLREVQQVQHVHQVQQVHQTSSSQSLNFMNLYSQNQQVETNSSQQGQQQQQHVNKYACLQNMGKQQPVNNQNYSQPQHSQSQTQHTQAQHSQPHNSQQVWPQQQPNYGSMQQQQPLQTPYQPQQNQQVNIMNLYGQPQQQQQQQQNNNVYAGYRISNSAQYQ